jgi:MFS family permease
MIFGFFDSTQGKSQRHRDWHRMRLPKGQFIINVQMFGLLLGGIMWGIIGDKLGRIKFFSVLFYYIP